MKRKIFGFIIALSLVLSPAVALGQSANGNNVESIQAQIDALLEELKVLHEKLAEARREVGGLRQEIKSTVEEFRTQLRVGLRGEEVTLLQEVLATDSDLYPEGLVTGYYGPLTRKAVMKFQERYGIDSVGEVGPQTRRALNAFFKKDKGKSGKISKGLFRKFESDNEINDPDDDSATSTDSGNRGRAFGRTKVSVCHRGKTITVGAPAVNAHLGHGDSVGNCGGDNGDDGDGDNGDDNGDNGNGTNDTTAPVISSLALSDIGTSTAKISWTTDEDATSRVVYGTSTPVTLNGTYMDSALATTSHMMNLSGLSASTTHYYLVSSTDTAGNTATSSEAQFTTLNE